MNLILMAAPVLSAQDNDSCLECHKGSAKTVKPGNKGRSRILDMDLVVFTGRMPVEELMRDKPLEYERLKGSGGLDQRLAPPCEAAVVRAMRVFGWVALSCGFGMVVWIVYSMVFAYR